MFLMLDYNETFKEPSYWYCRPHHQINQEPPCPPRLQEETSMIGGVLTRFRMLDLDETISKASLGYFDYLDTISTSIRNTHVL